jgi:hypothetical protein
MTCGAKKVSEYGSVTLVCNLEAGHDPAFHGVTVNPAAPPYVRWGPGVEWTAEDDARRAERYTWSKGHVRRDYQSASQAKAMLEHQNAVANLRKARGTT